MNKTRLLFSVLALLVWGGGHAAYAGVAVVPGKWIVELECPPALEYEGRTDLALQSADGSTRASAAPTGATAPHVTGERYSVHAPAVQAYTAFLDDERSHFLDEAGFALGRQLQPDHVYRHTLNGFSIELSDEEAERLGQLPGVRSVQPVLAYELHLDSGPEVIHATDVHAGLPGVPANGGEGVVIGIVDSGINWDHPYFSDAALGSFSFSNPYGRFLGECADGNAQCNNKLVGVYEFTEDGGSAGKDLNGPGTHVASMAAGVPVNLSSSGYTYRTTGVAPHANIISYKVCVETEDKKTSCSGESIVAAWEQALADGVDVFNFSVGSDSQPSPWESSLPLLRMFSAGITFVNSAGNSGPGYGTVGWPANAPWVFSVGNSTHSRTTTERATVAGLENIALVYGDGSRLSAAVSGPLVAADELGDDDLGCARFPGGSLDGAVVLIQRGECSFGEKVGHAADAGAAAVLVYNNVQGPPITMAEVSGHGIPAAMMSRADGLAVRDAMARHSSPTAILVRGSIIQKNKAWQDQITASSSRGPVSPSGLMKPNVVAPGTSVLGGYYEGSPPYAFMTGTSMASPHVAGAVGLLKSLYPDWTPDMLQSTLETTAETAPVLWDLEPASAFDRGNGRIRVDLAAQAGLYLPVSMADFIQANPAVGGNPEDLNLAGILTESCSPDCSFRRTVKAIHSGEWKVATGGDLDIAVSPSSFSLAEGASRTLDIKVSAGSSQAGTLAEGYIELVPRHSGAVPQRLQVAVGSPGFEFEEPIEWVVYSNRERRVETISLGAVSELEIHASDPVLPERKSFELREDSSPDKPYTGSSGRRTFLVDVPESALVLTAGLVSTSAEAVSVFVGRDGNGNGKADESEEYCAAVGEDAKEPCVIELPEAGTWWVMVQNRSASKTGASDDIEIEYAVLAADSGSGFVVSGPGQHAGGELDLLLSLDAPGLLKDRQYVAAVGLSRSGDLPGSLGVQPVRIKRVGDNRPQPTALFDGESLPVVIPGKKVHDLLFVDVPPGATGLEVEVSGQTGISGQLFRLDHDEVADAAPGTPPAPTDGALDEGRDAGSGFVLGHSSSSGISAGRYYVVLDNNFANERRVNVMASIKQSAAPAPVHYGLWSDHGRGINQGFDWGVGQAGSQPIASLVWYTYDEDGLPVFYTANAPIDPDSATWSSELLRVTSNNERDHLSTVGRVSVTELAADDMIIAWRLNGRHGSSRVRPDHSQACAVVDGESRSYSGHWYASGLAQGGTTMIVTDAVQTQVRDYFDAVGVGRWVVTDYEAGDGPLAAQLALVEFHGYCDGCEAREISSETVGSYARLFHDEYHATEIVEFVSRPPLGHDYSAEVEIERLTTRLECP